MIIKMKRQATEEQIAHVIQVVREKGYKIHKSMGEERTIVGVLGDLSTQPEDDFYLPGVEEIVRLSKRYKLASRDFKPEETVVDVEGIKIGDGHPPVFMAGPCTVEDREDLKKIAEMVKKAGAKILRGGCWKPRTYPGDFEGLKEKGLEYLHEAGREFGMPVVTEVMRPEDVGLVAQYAQILQVGTRNMQNYTLLEAVGRQEGVPAKKPVLLKRGYAAKLSEFLGAADRIIQAGNGQVILCLRGIRIFDDVQRFPADLYAVEELLTISHLPVCFDPSHSSGMRSKVPRIARMASAGNVHAHLIEAHYDPGRANCDSKQHIAGKELESIIEHAMQEYGFSRERGLV